MGSYYTRLFCILANIFPAEGVESKHIVPSPLLYGLVQVAFESV